MKNIISKKQTPGLHSKQTEKIYQLETIEELKQCNNTLKKSMNNPKIKLDTLKDILLKKLFRETGNMFQQFHFTDEGMKELVQYKIQSNLSLCSCLLKHDKNLSFDEFLLHIDAGSKVQTFKKVMNKMNDEEYWKYLAECYMLSDYEKVSFTLLKSLFSRERPCRENLMTKSEINFFNKLPDEITIYRACSPNEIKSNKFGISWTLSQKVAEFFLSRKGLIEKKGGKIVTKIINRKDAVAYFNSRKEQEIIFLGN